MRRLSFPLALSFALLLLLAQAGAVAHEFSHFDADADEADEVCALCLAAAALDFAASPPPAPDLGLSFASSVAYAPRRVFRVSSPCRAYRERAPPVLAHAR
ncbi:MAG: hypothetical protein LBF93_05770 [Zoogloeaceae bacterium]|jgi:hypothetical protein|nr:hypothetical protein [Zoogloeaceae bacterium]